MNLDTISFTVTAPGASGTAMAALTGDVAVIRNSPINKACLCIAAWTNSQLAGSTRIVWPSGHDLTRGVNYNNIALTPTNRVPMGMPWRFRPQDPLSVTQIGSVTAGDVETFHMLMWYEDVPGVDAHLINMATLRKRGVNALTILDSSTSAAGGAAYSGQRTFVSVADTYKPNTDYALLGASVGANCGALCVRGVDSGNLRCAIPGDTRLAEYAANWFGMLSDAHGVPAIPVFNSANRAAILIDQVNNELVPAVPFTLYLVELAP